MEAAATSQKAKLALSRAPYLAEQVRSPEAGLINPPEAFINPSIQRLISNKMRA